MSIKNMLVDATQPEETRVAVVSENNLLQDFDFESQVIKQLKSNIYLAKVTRVEPSLQAAFLEYGGNRQAFLPFSEIHPDYFRIPIADREKLIEQEKKELDALDSQDDEEDDEEIAELQEGESLNTAEENASEDDDEDDSEEDSEDEVAEEDDEDDENDSEDELREEGEEASSAEKVKSAKVSDGGDLIDEEIEEAKPRFRVSHRQYKIQEVIKPRQIMLIQISKEERGNKGAAVSTYISLPGRYCVLMPNSSHGGGVSRKIGNPAQRKKMKKTLESLGVPEGMSVILRTAGIERTKLEIKRDLDYLLRLWNSIREKTLESTAPALVYEEGNLIKRSIRDLYDNDIDEVIVSGKDGYKEAKDFMKMLMPSHAKKVKEYKDEKVPLFQKFNVEKQIDDVFSTSAHMKSGGYIVINPTEALVSIDVNSGRSTKERHIEETALQTNLEAAEEVARQLRLRDLGGLVVIDFIDMESYRHNRLVEKRLRECLAKDRARVQVGRISNFGLLELSRQRLRPSLFETNFHECVACNGMGRVRTIESASLMVLRAIEKQAIDQTKEKQKGDIFVKVHADVALYILNQKRHLIASVEERHGLRVYVNADSAQTTASYSIVKADGTEIKSVDSALNSQDQGGHEHKHKHRGEHRGEHRSEHRGEHRGEHKHDSKHRHNKPSNQQGPQQAQQQNQQNPRHQTDEDEGDEEGGSKRRRRRGRRGGRRRNQRERGDIQGQDSLNPENTVNRDVSDNGNAKDQGVEAAAVKSESSQDNAPRDRNRPRGRHHNKGRERQEGNRQAENRPEGNRPEGNRNESAPLENKPKQATVIPIEEKAPSEKRGNTQGSTGAKETQKEERSEGQKSGSSSKRKAWWNRLKNKDAE